MNRSTRAGRHGGRWTGAAGVALLLALAGCGGGGDAAPAGQAAPTAAASAVGQVLNIDIGALARYAGSALPPAYDADVVALDNTPRADPVDDRIATLGRVLFYDRALSVNDSIACASCHRQALGFGDSRRFSTGFEGGLTTATSMRLGNVRYFRPGSMFWDRRAPTLEAQALEPIQHPVEMGFDAAHGGTPALLAKLQALPVYGELFALAYGDAQVTEARIARALAHFQRAMVSAGSRWDSGFAANYDPGLPDKGLDRPIAGFDAQENRGLALFMRSPAQGGAGCAGCHVPPTFALAPGARGNGLDAGEATVFKSPSLKSVARSGAFMHDGRFATLAEVVDHYDRGVRPGPALDARLVGPNGQPRRLNLADADRAALVAFLLTLDDPGLAADTRFGDPFRR